MAVRKGRMAGDNSVLVMSQQINPQPLQLTQSAQVGSLGQQQERTPYSPFGRYPVSDGLIDFGEPQNNYRSVM